MVGKNTGKIPKSSAKNVNASPQSEKKTVPSQRENFYQHLKKSTTGYDYVEMCKLYVYFHKNIIFLIKKKRKHGIILVHINILHSLMRRIVHLVYE